MLESGPKKVGVSNTCLNRLVEHGFASGFVA